MIYLEHDKWLTAIKKELKCYNTNGTWRVVDCQRGQKRPLILYWVWTIKYDSTYKACLVCCGFNQVENVDFYELYAVVLKSMLFKVFVAIVAKNGWPFYHIDIITMFLNAEMKESVYIKLLEEEYKRFLEKIGLLL